MLRTIALSAGATALLLATPAFAHHPSGAGAASGAGPIVTIPAETLEEGHISAAVVFEYLRFKALSDAALSAAGDAHSLDAILAPSLVYAYGVTDNLTLSLRLPFLQRTGIRESSVSGGGSVVEELGDSAGVGDLSLLAQYRFFFDRAAGIQLALLAGLKLPTGDTSVRATTGERFESEFQPGGGAWEGSLGLALTKRFGALSLDANVLYVLAAEGAQDTNLGDRLLYNLALSYRLRGASTGQGAMYAGLPPPMYHGGPKAEHGHEHADEEVAPPKGPSLDLVLELNGEWHGGEKVAGVADPNSGGTVMLLSPGLRLSYEQWSGFVSFGVPVFSELNGVQAEPDWRVLTGISVNF